MLKGARSDGPGDGERGDVWKTARVTKVAQSTTPTSTLTATDIAVLNFALNLEYLEAEFYTKAFYGLTLEEFGGIPITGSGKQGPTTGGKKVKFEALDECGTRSTRPSAGDCQADHGNDEQTHVKLLHQLLGTERDCEAGDQPRC